MNRIVLSFKGSRDSELAKKGSHILSSIKGNSFFPDTTLVQALEKSLQEYQAALDAAGDGSRKLISIKDDKRLALEEVLTELAFYVSRISKGDKSMLISSGFDLAKERGISAPLSPIEKVVVQTIESGEASIIANRVVGARAYIHQYTTDPPNTNNTVWVSETTAHRKHTFKGLKPAVMYWFRVIAIGLYGQSVTSNPVPRLVN